MADSRFQRAALLIAALATLHGLVYIPLVHRHVTTDTDTYVAAAHALEHVGLPEAHLNLAQAAIYLARAPKSNASALAIWEARRDVREHGNAPPPASISDRRSVAGRSGRPGEDYVYPHDDPRGFEVDYLPEALRGRRYYRPSGNGEEGDGVDRSG